MSSINIETRDGCVLAKGTLTISAISGVSAMAPKGSVLDTDLARMAGVDLAAGLPADVESLKAKLRLEIERTMNAAPSDGTDPELRKWLALGRRGASSNALAAFLSERSDIADLWDKRAHPSDPDDLWRCRRLLEEVPSLQAPFRARAGSLSPVWARLVAAWDDLCATMDAEAPEWGEGRGSAPMTYAKMRAIIDAEPQHA
ncbi:MAG: hypothetical protein EPN36_14205 [Rhodanobacteraceae bacterium]|nr:MAG: hypothetical protein EPN36_14205 [Rhodanobacteraceae bacterium]